MEEEQIIKALECCDQEDKCHECPYDLKCYDDKYKSIIAKDALELINRQKAEIERLQSINEILESAFVAECDLSACPRKKEIRDEAIKEFEKKMSNILFLDSYSTEKIKEKMRAVKKEMEGDE